MNTMHLMRRTPKKEVAWKQRFFEFYRLSAVFLEAFHARQHDDQAFSTAKIHKLFFTPGPCVRDVPWVRARQSVCSLLIIRLPLCASLLRLDLHCIHNQYFGVYAPRDRIWRNGAFMESACCVASVASISESLASSVAELNMVLRHRLGLNPKRLRKLLLNRPW